MNSKQTVCVTWFCVFLLLSCQFANVDARKQVTRKPSSSTSSHVSRPSGDSKPSNSHTDQAKLSYANYDSAPNPPKTQQPVAQASPAAVATPDAAKPIGWNVPDGNVQKQTVQNTNSAPYPHQPQQAPPPYSPHPNANTGGNSHPHDAPPPYQNAAPPPQYSGAPVGGYQQGGLPQQHGGFPQQHGGFPQQGGYPQQGGFPQQGGYPQQGGIQQQGGYPQQGGFPQQQPYPVVIQQQPQKSSGNGLQTALLAGVGGLALYGALKPSEEKIIIINGESTTSSPSGATTAATTAPVASAADANPSVTPVTPVAGAPVAAVPVAAVPVAGAPVATVPVTEAVPLAPMPSVAVPTDNGTSATPDASTNIPVQPNDSNTPLASFPVTVTMAPTDIPPFSGSAIQYDQVPLAPLAPFPTSQPPPICAPGQNPNDMKCTPLTVSPMYVTPSATDGTATAQTDVGIPVSSNTNQNLQAQAALKNSAVPCTLVAINLVIIPILTLLVV